MSPDPAVEITCAQGAQLIEPALEMEQAYRKFLQEFIDAGEEGVLNWPADIDDPMRRIRRLKDHARGMNLPEGCVACSCYWLLSEREVLLGEVHIRHTLTPALEDYGGHIGFMVRPGERGKGHAARMLALALGKARSLGLNRVLLTCAPDNTASARVIQKNGGKLAGESAGGAPRRAARYWIDL